MIKRKFELLPSDPAPEEAASSRKTRASEVDFDDEEPQTLRRPQTQATEEVSEVRPIQYRREPKIVPPKNGEEMLRRRQELVRRKKSGEKMPPPPKVEASNPWETVLGKRIQESLDQVSVTLQAVKTLLTRDRTSPEYPEEVALRTTELFHHRDALDNLVLELTKMRSNTREFRSQISMSIMNIEDALHDIHK